MRTSRSRPSTKPASAGCVREFVLVWSRLPPEVKPARYEVLERFGVNDLAWSQGGESGEQFPLFGAAALPQCSRRQKQ